MEALLTSYDFSAFAGLEVVLADVPGLRCGACGAETLPGSVINFTLDCLAAEFVRSPDRLTAAQARYLRKHLGLSQKDLAERMGIYRETVAKWECGESEISPPHDYILRGLSVIELRGFADLWREIDCVRTAPPPRRCGRLLLSGMAGRISEQQSARRAAG